MPPQKPLSLHPNAHILPADVAAVARHGRRVGLAPAAVKAMNASRKVVQDALDDGLPHYGINTGFGSLAKQRINARDLATLQRNLIRSHTAGAMEPLREELVRAMMLCLASSLSRGFSGVRPVLVSTLVAMLNKGVVPVVPSVGSVGASGDLAPLAAVALVMIGEGHATYKGRRTTGAAALRAARIKPVTLGAKEGLALINGTHLMAAEAALLMHDTATLFDAAVLALAMSIDASRASHSFLDARLYEARNNDNIAVVAAQLRHHLRGSTIVTSHKQNDPRVQDPYSLRAGPTILGAALHTIIDCHRAVHAELQAVTDNPLVFPSSGKKEAIVSGANFHGMPLALPLDTLALALTHIAGVSERRTYFMTGAFEPETRLRPFLAGEPGLSSGLMIAQYTAAACVNEMVTLCTPASVSNIPTCAGMEDYNSFGPRAAAKARRALQLASRVVGIELLTAAAGVECHRPHRSGRGVESAIGIIREIVPPLKHDRPLVDDIERLAAAIADGTFE